MKTLVFLTGWACPPPILHPFLTALANGDRCERDGDRYVVTGDRYCVVAPDWANHDNYADFVEITLNEMGGQVPLVGWSTGAVIAIETALKLPERVRSLSLISGTACFCERPGYACGQPEAAIQTMLRALDLSPPARVLNEFFRRAALPGKLTGKALKEWVQHDDQPGAHPLSRGLEYLLRTDLRASLAELNGPVLALHGRNDQIIPAAAGEWICTHTSNALYTSFDDEGHLLPMLHPQRIADEIVTFLEQD